MTDNTLLAFEHALRAHVNNALARCSAFDECMGEYNTTWCITYDIEKGGIWRVHAPYRYGQIVSKAAMLDVALTNAFDMVRAVREAMVLPSLITNESN